MPRQCLRSVDLLSFSTWNQSPVNDGVSNCAGLNIQSNLSDFGCASRQGFICKSQKKHRKYQNMLSEYMEWTCVFKRLDESLLRLTVTFQLVFIDHIRDSLYFIARLRLN